MQRTVLPLVSSDRVEGASRQKLSHTGFAPFREKGSCPFVLPGEFNSDETFLEHLGQRQRLQETNKRLLKAGTRTVRENRGKQVSQKGAPKSGSCVGQAEFFDVTSHQKKAKDQTYHSLLCWWNKGGWSKHECSCGDAEAVPHTDA